jgi:glycosyltransferase involved in cell wall biosynthesis
MWRYLRLMRDLGPCRVVSARTRPVGAGWTPQAIGKFQEDGFELRFREDSRGRSVSQQVGMAYAALFKGLKVDRAFGHSNPYHRYAFPADWWQECLEGIDVAFINYGYWAWLPCSCRKVVHLHDLLSDYMWEGPARETAELSSADLVIVLSTNEEMILRARGIRNLMWAPPAVDPHECPLTERIGLVGSGNLFNVEGLRWLRSARVVEPAVRVYGSLADRATNVPFVPVGRYTDSYLPYEECGIILVTTAQGTGVQVKTIEALACARAIVARRGAMRGIPAGEGAWIEVETPQQMIAEAARLGRDADARTRLAAKAREYYRRHLDSAAVNERLRTALARESAAHGLPS